MHNFSNIFQGHTQQLCMYIFTRCTSSCWRQDIVLFLQIYSLSGILLLFLWFQKHSRFFWFSWASNFIRQFFFFFQHNFNYFYLFLTNGKCNWVTGQGAKSNCKNIFTWECRLQEHDQLLVREVSPRNGATCCWGELWMLPFGAVRGPFQHLAEKS